LDSIFCANTIRINWKIRWGLEPPSGYATAVPWSRNWWQEFTIPGSYADWVVHQSKSNCTVCMGSALSCHNN